MSTFAVAVPARANRKAKLQCTSCDGYFDASARRVRLIQEGKSSRCCDVCRALDRRAPVNVQASHRHYWYRAIATGMVTVGGETVTLEWVKDVVAMMDMTK